MKIVDLNLLVYAVNQKSEHHTVARKWWERAMVDEEPLGLAWVVLLGFLRLSTNHKVFPNPLTTEQATDRVRAWIGHDNTKIVLETEDHWHILSELLEGTGTAGNLTTDAHLASLAISYGAVLVSFDGDFSRFPRVRWENPLRA